MYFSYDSGREIHVSNPYKRTMIPYMMSDTASCPINFSVHLTTWEPGSQVDEHMHPDAMEVMFCIAGHGTASVGDQEYDFCVNSMIAAAPGEMHCIKNTGDTQLVAVCVFSPPVTGEDLAKRAQAAVDANKK